MPKVPSTIWPRPYILQAYERALEDGCARILSIGGAEKAKSFIAAFYRIRRKADSAMQANYIRPEFDLVSATYEPALDSILLIFNALPDGSDLPKIVSVDRSTIAKQPTMNAPPLTLGDVDSDADIDIGSTIEQLIADAAKKSNR